MSLIKCGDINLEYYDEGEGPPLLMIMGFGGQAASWGEPILAELRKSFRCIRVSNRGTGDSGRPTEPFTIRTMADDAVALLDALGVAKAHVFGVSMGGMIAQELVLTYPERVEGLVLGCTTPGGLKSQAAEPEVFEMIMPVPGLSREEQIRKAWPGITTPQMVEQRDVLELMLSASLAKPTPVDTILKQMVAIQGFDAYDRLPSIKKPTLVIHGDRDRLVPPENGRLIHAQIPGSTLEMMPDAAHMFFWEQPRKSAEIVTSFLKSVPATA